MNIATFPKKKTIPYYNQKGNSFFKRINEYAKERDISFINYLLFKYKIIVFQFFASKCPFNKLRVKMHRWRGVRVGENVYIGKNVFIDNLYPDYVVIEDNVHLHAESMIIAHFNPAIHFSNIFEAVANPVILKQFSIVGIRAIVLPGVTVGEYSMITAGSVVAKNIPAYSLVQGNPAKIILNYKHFY